MRSGPSDDRLDHSRRALHAQAILQNAPPLRPLVVAALHLIEQAGPQIDEHLELLRPHTCGTPRAIIARISSRWPGLARRPVGPGMSMHGVGPRGGHQTIVYWTRVAAAGETVGVRNLRNSLPGLSKELRWFERAAGGSRAMVRNPRNSLLGPSKELRRCGGPGGTGEHLLHTHPPPMRQGTKGVTIVPSMEPP